jgi:hypothetical protein
MTTDNRVTWDFITEIPDTVERHGYQRAGNLHTGRAILLIGDLARIYEGTQDYPAGTHLSNVPTRPEPAPAPPAPEPGQSTTTLSAAEIKTIVGVLDAAADHERARAETCADQSCPACQWPLRSAESYDRLALRVLRPAAHAQAAHRNQPEAASPDAPPNQAHTSADKEAGQ